MNTDANADGNYEMAADGKIEIEYQVKVKDSIVYIGKWERDIELFNYNAEIDSNRSSIKFLNIYGTDLQKYCLIERVYEYAVYTEVLDYTVGYNLQN